MTSPLTTGLVPHEAGAAEVSRREFQSRLAGIGNLNGKKMTEAEKEKKLREACEGFESIFIQKMWQEMRNTLPKTNMLQGREEQFWQSMYDQELAKSMTAAGGIGLADMMYAQLSRNLVSASRSTASSVGGAPSGFTPQAASILPAGGNDESAAADGPGGLSASGGGQGGAGHSAMRGGAPIPSVYDGIAPVQDVGESGRIQVLPGGMASAETAGAAGLPASQAAQAAGPPEVEQALAALRARQDTAQDKEQHASPNMNTGLHLARAARFEAGSKLGSRGVLPRTHLAQPHQPLQAAQTLPSGGSAGHVGNIPPLTGQTMQGVTAQQAAQQVAAGDMQMLMAQSMGTPAAMQAAMNSMAQPGNAAAYSAGQPMPQSMPQSAPQTGAPVPRPPQAAPTGGIVTPGPSVPGALASDPGHEAQEAAAQAEPHIQKVRYTTNVPPSKRKTSGSAILRSLSADAVGPNSRAGAGLAAYHAQQASQLASQQAVQPLTASAPAAQGQNAPVGAASAPVGGQVGAMTGQPVAAQPGMATSAPSAQQARQGMESYGIPPLTATDLRR
ncbi:rod-binding protein [Desulfovibrio sp.]|uniref:rod-binding protein n=1 Tax=Desulfovibrio sp. TaxID=885 RepID=UPI0025C5429D|nr:rod-binding protein [Desulfovibrio sp.]